MSTAVIAGATGLVGKQLLQRLLAHPSYSRVVALVRRPMEISHPKLEERVIDFDRLGELELPEGSDIYCALGTTIRTAGSQDAFRRVDYTYVVELARAGARASARSFAVVSSIGADATSRNFYTRVKGEMEEAVSREPYRSIHIFRPSFLLGDRHEERPGERIGIALAKLFTPLMLGPLRKYRPIRVDSVAEAMIEAVVSGGEGVRVWEGMGLRAG